MILNGSTNNNTALGAQKTQPVGILYGAAAGNVESNSYPEVILSQTAGGYDYNTLINIQMALAPQYESPETCWIMQKRSTYAAVNQIKDSQSRPLFTTGYSDSGMVERRGRILLGDPDRLRRSPCRRSRLRTSPSSTATSRVTTWPSALASASRSSIRPRPRSIRSS